MATTGSIEHKLNKILFMFKIRSYCAIHKLLLDSHISLFPRHNLFLCPKRNFGRHSNGTVRLWRFVSSAFPISIEVGIPNLVCGCILGWRSVPYHFGVTVTLTSHLVFRIFLSGAYLIIWGTNSKFGVCMHLGMTKCRKPSLGHCDLDLWPSF